MSELQEIAQELVNSLAEKETTWPLDIADWRTAFICLADAVLDEPVSTADASRSLDPRVA